MNDNTNINYRDYRLNLLAGVDESINVQGDSWQIITADAGVMLRFDEQVAITRYLGMGGGSRYRTVTVTSAVDQVVVISLGMTGNPETYDSRGLGLGVSVNAVVNIASTFSSDVDVSLAAATQTIALALNANRIEGFLQLDEAAPDFVRYGDSSVSAAKGLKLYPGDTVIFSNKAAIYVFNPNAVAVTIRGADGAI